MADPDLSVKLKAIDIFGAREANAAVALMSRWRRSKIRTRPFRPIRNSQICAS